MDKKQTITTERKIGKSPILFKRCRVKRQPIQSIKRLKKLIVKDLQKKSPEIRAF